MQLASAKAPFYGTEKRQMAMHLHAVAALTGEVPMYWSLRVFAATVCYVPAQSTTVVAVQSTWDADVSETPTPRWYCRKSSRSFQRPCNTAFQVPLDKVHDIGGLATGGRKPLLTSCGRPTGRSAWRRDNEINRTKGVYLGMNLFQGYEEIESTRSIKWVNVVRSTFI